jgi:GntR family transcriptional regulator, rspAB operon transcriptional repressor
MLLRENVYHEIRRAILRCELPPGQELREQMLADRYHVSRSPIRDALLRLEQERLVTVLPRQGYRINPITLCDFQDLCGLRRLLEPACAAAAARLADPRIADLDRFRWQSAPLQRFGSYIDYNSAFHNAVAELGGNARSTAIARDMLEQITRVQKHFSAHFDQPPPREYLMEHDAIIDAIQAHDADLAFERAAAHVEHAAREMTELLRQPDT